MPRRPERTRLTAPDAYLAAHQKAQRLAEAVYDRLFDLPAPDGAVRIDWTHVGTLNEVNHRLAAVVAFLEGTEA